MPERQDATKPTLVRAVIEVAFILFLFYANLLMGEFTRRSAPGKTLAFALRDILTGRTWPLGWWRRWWGGRCLSICGGRLGDGERRAGPVGVVVWCHSVCAR